MPVSGESHPQYPSIFWSGTRWDLKTVAGAKAHGACRTAFCRGVARVEYRTDRSKGRIVQHSHCDKCTSRRWRLNNPLKSAFKDLKKSARHRGIPFTLTLQEFDDFCLRSGYLAFKGCAPTALHVDRIDPTKGYSADNIQALTASENVAKGNRERRQAAVRRKIKGRHAVKAQIVSADDCPF